MCARSFATRSSAAVSFTSRMSIAAVARSGTIVRAPAPTNELASPRMFSVGYCSASCSLGKGLLGRRDAERLQHPRRVVRHGVEHRALLGGQRRDRVVEARHRGTARRHPSSTPAARRAASPGSASSCRSCRCGRRSSGRRPSDRPSRCRARRRRRSAVRSSVPVRRGSPSGPRAACRGSSRSPAPGSASSLLPRRRE